MEPFTFNKQNPFSRQNLFHGERLLLWHFPSFTLHLLPHPNYDHPCLFWRIVFRYMSLSPPVKRPFQHQETFHLQVSLYVCFLHYLGLCTCVCQHVQYSQISALLRQYHQFLNKSPEHHWMPCYLHHTMRVYLMLCMATGLFHKIVAAAVSMLVLLPSLVFLTSWLVCRVPGHVLFTLLVPFSAHPPQTFERLTLSITSPVSIAIAMPTPSLAV